MAGLVDNKKRIRLTLIIIVGVLTLQVVITVITVLVKN